MDTRKTEECSCDKPLTFETSNPQEHAKYWVAVLVQINTEKKVSSKLSKLGYHNYVPTQTTIRQWSDRKKKIERIVIPMVIFVLVDKKEENNLRKSPFIYKFISYPGEREAAIIPNEQIDNLKFMLNHADATVNCSNAVYEIGEEIEIARGPLKGLHGELCHIEKGKPMVGVYVNLLGYSYVDVDIKDIKRRT